MRTDQEKQEAIETLTRNRANVSKYGGFGYDRHAAIDAMLRVIREDMDDDDIWDEWPDCETPEFEAAQSAKEFLNGSTDLSDIVYPE